MITLLSRARGRTAPARASVVAALIITALVATVTDAALLPDPAQAQGQPVAQATLPSAVPAATTPNLRNGTVFAIASVGSVMILGGSFTSVQNANSTVTGTRQHILAFDTSSGTVSTTFKPALNGNVQALAAGPVAGTVYVGGTFTTVNGVAARGLTLLDTRTGAIVSGWTPPVINGSVTSIVATPSHVFIGGAFTKVGKIARGGFVSLDPDSGQDDGYASLAFVGHHNYRGSSGVAKGAVGPRAMSLNPAGTRLMVVGNFTSVGGSARDQIAMLDVDGSSAALDADWATLGFSSPCFSSRYDTYVNDVQWSPDGTYFAVAAGGGSGTNTDGTRSLCDATSRWAATDVGTDVQPTWVDYTGQDSLWSIAVTGAAIYVGGHPRWMNNANGLDVAGAGAVPRPGMAALDPINGLPLLWNPGRNPRGAGAYAILATGDALYVGSDTDYIGNMQYLRRKIAEFPLAGGYTPASSAVAALPSNLYLAGPMNPPSGVSRDALAYRPMSTTQIGDLRTTNTNLAWSNVRGAFLVGSQLFVPYSDGKFYRASFDGSKLGTASAVDPYDDPTWDGVATGATSGASTYDGKQPDYYGSLGSITGQFYADGRIFYTTSFSDQLHWRYFSPDAGVVGSTDNTVTWQYARNIAGMTISGNTVYLAQLDGTLHTENLSATGPDATSDRTISGPSIDGRNWAAHSLFLYGQPSF